MSAGVRGQHVRVVTLNPNPGRTHEWDALKNKLQSKKIKRWQFHVASQAKLWDMVIERPLGRQLFHSQFAKVCRMHHYLLLACINKQYINQKPSYIIKRKLTPSGAWRAMFAPNCCPLLLYMLQTPIFNFSSLTSHNCSFDHHLATGRAQQTPKH